MARPLNEFTRYLYQLIQNNNEDSSSIVNITSEVNLKSKINISEKI